MVSVVILAKTSAFTVPGWVIAFGVMLAAVFGAVATWIFSAKSRRQKFMRLALSCAVFGLTAVMVWDCSWMPDWMCFGF